MKGYELPALEFKDFDHAFYIGKPFAHKIPIARAAFFTVLSA